MVLLAERNTRPEDTKINIYMNNIVLDKGKNWTATVTVTSSSILN